MDERLRNKRVVILKQEAGFEYVAAIQNYVGVARIGMKYDYRAANVSSIPDCLK